MRVRFPVGVCALVAAVTTVFAVPTLGAAPSTADCAHRSTGARFSSFGGKNALVVGPLSFPNGRAYSGRLPHDPGGWLKTAAILRPGHTARVKIAQRPRRTTGFVGFGQEGRGTSFAASRRSVTFTACGRGRSGSTAGGQPVTFWSGGFSRPNKPACVPLDVYLDHSHTPRRVTISLGAGRCPR